MPTIIGPTTVEFPKHVYPAVVDVKPTWSADWQFTSELQFVRASVCSSGQDLDSCELKRRYGTVKLPWEATGGPKPAWGSGAGWWSASGWSASRAYSRPGSAV